MEYEGHSNVEELSRLLKNESPRCAVIIAAAFFDETLKSVLENRKDRSSLSARIDNALEWGILSPNEHHDLKILCELRNGFAHELRRKELDADSEAKVGTLKLWQTASEQRAGLDVFDTPMKRLWYVVGTIAFRLQHRTRSKTKNGPHAEPSGSDLSAWPSVEII